MYPEYTGMLLSAVAEQTKPPTSAQAAYEEAKAFVETERLDAARKNAVLRLGRAGHAAGYASEHKLTSIADLKPLGKKVKLGGAPEFATRSRALLGLKRNTASSRRSSRSRSNSYKALESGQVDVQDVFTTDGQLLGGKFKVLADPKHVFGFQNVAPIVKQSVLDAEGPEFAETLNKVSALLTIPAIQQMNKAVTIEKQSADERRQQFLKRTGSPSPCAQPRPAERRRAASPCEACGDAAQRRFQGDPLRASSRRPRSCLLGLAQLFLPRIAATRISSRIGSYGTSSTSTSAPGRRSSCCGATPTRSTVRTRPLARQPGADGTLLREARGAAHIDVDAPAVRVGPLALTRRALRKRGARSRRTRTRAARRCTRRWPGLQRAAARQRRRQGRVRASGGLFGVGASVDAVAEAEAASSSCTRAGCCSKASS